MRVHPDLEWARDQASRFRVLPSERGFNVWVFRAWDRPFPGWRIVVADVKTARDGWAHVRKRMGLTEAIPPEPLPPAPPRPRPVEDDCY